MSAANQSKWKLLVEIFISFFKIGPVTFGGGYAMIPLIEREVVERKKWVNQRDVTDVFAVAESVPGAIAINSATFIGYRLAGVLGAIAAMTGVLLPTFMIVLGLCFFFLQVRDNAMVAAAFEGIRAAIVALIAYAGYKIGRTGILDKTTLAVTIGTVVVLLFSHIHPVLIILSGFVLGIGLVWIRKRFGITTRIELQVDEDDRRFKYSDYFIGDGI